MSPAPPEQPRRCEHCRRPIHAWRPKRARFCDEYCQKRRKKLPEGKL